MEEQLWMMQQAMLRVLGGDTHGSSRVGCRSTETGSTATGTCFQSVDRHKDVDETTIVLWSRRLEYICHDDSSPLWSLGSLTVMETAALAARAVLNSAM